MDTSKLSQAARAEYEKLSGALADLVRKDATREPRLTDAEKSEIAGLQTRIEFLAPRIRALTAELEAADARRKEVTRTAVIWVMEGKAEPNELVAELVRLPELVRLLGDALTAALTETGGNQQRIERIKRAGRDREVMSHE